MDTQAKTLDPFGMNLIEWCTLIEKHLQTKESTQENPHYIRLNKQGDIALFEKKREGKRLGFKENIPFSRILEITILKMKECNTQNEIDKARQLLSPLIFKKLSKPLEKLSSQQLKVIKLFEHASLFVPQTANIIPPNMRLFMKKELKKATHMNRSEHGDTGVYFIKGSSLILKIRGNPLPHILADRFFEKLGFVVPHYFSVRANSKLGRLALTTMTPLVRKYFDQKKKQEQGLASQYIVTDYSSRFEQQLKCSCVMGMERVPGKIFTMLNCDDLQVILKDKDLLQVLGQIIFLDFFIGNSDRLSTTGCNTGNFLYHPKGHIPIILIDHDYTLSRASFDIISKNVMNLLEGEKGVTLDAVVRAFTTKLQINREPLSCDLTFIKECFWKGICESAQKLVRFFSGQPHLVYEITDVPTEREKPDAESFFRLLYLVRKKIIN